MTEQATPGLSAEANIFAKHPDGFSVHIKVICENGKAIVSNLDVAIAGLIAKNYTPDARPAPQEPVSRANGNGGGNGHGGGNGGGQRMYDVTCDECQRNTKVPFQPRGDGRPVYCRDCYSRQRQPAGGRY